MASLIPRGPSKPPTVSVIVLCYNQARFVHEALASVLAQEVPLELTIVDDASTDDSQDLIRKWARDYRGSLQLILHETNQGICRSSNDGLATGSAPYVAFLDADDYWLPGKLGRQVQLMEALPPTVGVLYGDTLLCNEEGATLPGAFIGTQTRPLSRPRPSGWVFRNLLISNFIPGPSTLIRRSCFDDVGGFDEDLVYEDYEFWLRVSRRYQFTYDDAVLAVYRVVRGSTIRRLSGAINRDTIRIYRRYLHIAAERRLVAQQISHRSWRLYITGDDDGLRYLLMSIRYHPTLRATLIFPIALLGLRGRRLRRFRSLAKRAVISARTRIQR